MPAQPAENEPHLKSVVDALETALSAERDLRKLADSRVDDTREAARHALEDRERLIAVLNGTNGILHETQLKLVVSEEVATQLSAELEERRRRNNEFEAMLTTHNQLQDLMSEAIREAQEAKEEAEYARRVADENLRIMRMEFERAYVDSAEPNTTSP